MAVLGLGSKEQTGFRGEQLSAKFQITAHISSSDATDGAALVKGRLSTVHPFSEGGDRNVFIFDA